MCVCVRSGGAKQGQAARQPRSQGENSNADGSTTRSAVKRVGGGYAHTPIKPTKACSNAAAANSFEAPEQDGLPPKSPLPAARPATPEAAAAAAQELANSLAEMHIGGVASEAQRSIDTANAAIADNDLAGMSVGNLQARGSGGSLGGPAAGQIGAAAQPAPGGTPHGYVPSAQKQALMREELVLGSPSTRASTPQSRTQVGSPSGGHKRFYA